MAANAADIITPHPSQATPSPRATQGKAMTKPRLRTVVLTAQVDATNGTGKHVPYRVQAKFCTNIAQYPGVRNVMVSTIVPNRDTAIKTKNRSRFASKKARQIRFPPQARYRDTGIKTKTGVGSPLKKRGKYGFRRRLDTGTPE